MGEGPLFNIRFQSILGRWKMDENHKLNNQEPKINTGRDGRKTGRYSSRHTPKGFWSKISQYECGIVKVSQNSGWSPTVGLTKIPFLKQETSNVPNSSPFSPTFLDITRG